MDLVPGFAHRLGKPGHLFFKPSMARGTACLGGLLCPHLDLAAVVVALAAGFHRLHRIVRWRRWVVDIDLAIASPTVAAGSGGDAACNHRRRSRAHYGSPGF